MKLLLLCLGLTLVCAHHEGNHEVVTSNFDMSKISGQWYSSLIASDNKENVEGEDSLTMFVESIQVLDNSSLLLSYYQKVNGECNEISFIANKTEEKAEYRSFYNGQNTFRIIEVVYSDYVVLQDTNFTNGEETQMMELYARRPYVSRKLKKRFEKLCRKYGIPKENIVDLTKADRCLHARWSQKAQAASAE